jgi:mannose-6-phosphate isomerase
MEKKLYPFKFIPVPSRRPWGGSALVKELGKRFVECDENGNEVVLGEDVLIGESWELADMGIEDSVVANGWLAGNTISELMETYLERIVGEDVYNHYGRQFPLLIKFLHINDKLSVQVHPDDVVAAERYDSLGKTEIWYVMDAQPGAKIYCGFTREITAQEFYDRCRNCTIDQVLNVIEPKKGDVLFITPGTVHAADGGLLIAEIQESSDMTFRLYDWGREFDPATARKMHVEEAIDVIDYRPFDFSNYKHAHDHEHEMIETLVECPQFNVSKIALTDPLHIYTEKFNSFIVYVCLEGAASIQVPSTKENGEACMENYEFAKGETILVPADMPDFFLVPRDRSTKLLEAVTRPAEEIDEYIDPETEAFLENEDYEGLEDGVFDDEPQAPAGASPLNFFS